jgi:CheY-like chemotaxis protein
VLLVEDDPDQRRLIELLLGTLGARVTSEANGRAAVDRVMLARAQFDVIVMDLLMPVLDGAAATATLRAAGCHLPIIAVTAVHETGLRDLCLSAGFTDLLHKPVARGALVQTILKHVESGPLSEGDPLVRAVST